MSLTYPVFGFIGTVGSRMCSAHRNFTAWGDKQKALVVGMSNKRLQAVDYLGEQLKTTFDSGEIPESTLEMALVVRAADGTKRLAIPDDLPRIKLGTNELDGPRGECLYVATSETYSASKPRPLSDLRVCDE